MIISYPRDEFTISLQNQWQMLLLVFGRVGAHLDAHQHGISIQISVNLGKSFLRISRKWKIALTWILLKFLAYLIPFISQILDLLIPLPTNKSNFRCAKTVMLRDPILYCFPQKSRQLNCQQYE